MDTRTGELYDTKEAALAAGVPEEAIAELTRDGDYWNKHTNKRYPAPHQGKREMGRRRRQIEAANV